MGIGKGIKDSGAKRSDVFVTVKCGYAGPMGKQDGQIKSILKHMQLDFADLCMGHLPEVVPGTGSHGEYGKENHCVPTKSDYSAKACRINTYRSILDNMKAGRCKAVGVNSWNVTDLKEIEEAGLQLPSVVQYKFHLHQSAANSVQKELIDYCTEKGMTNTTLEEPKVKAIAAKVGKSPAQVLQRWIIQQGIAIQTRSMKQEHMEENQDV